MRCGLGWMRRVLFGRCSCHSAQSRLILQSMPKTEDAAPVIDDKAAAIRAKNLDLAIQQIEKDYGGEAIRRLGDATVSPVEIIPTGNIMIDRALGWEASRAGG